MDATRCWRFDTHTRIASEQGRRQRMQIPHPQRQISCVRPSRPS